MKAFLCSLAFLIAPAVAAVAQQPHATKVLPSFVVYDPTGFAVPSSELAAGARAVLLFVRPACHPCVQMLRDMARVADTRLGESLVIVVEGDAPAATAFLSRSLPDELRAARWYVDETGDAWQAQHLEGLPVTMGIVDQRVEWRLSGAPSRSLLESLVRTWLQPGDGGGR